MSAPNEENKEEQGLPPAHTQQLMNPPGPCGMPQAINLAMFMQQQHVTAAAIAAAAQQSGRHSAPALPTAAVAQIPPVDLGDQKEAPISSGKKKNTTEQWASSSRKSKGGGKGTHCTSEEKMIVCDVVGVVAPIGNPCWDEIEDLHNRRVPKNGHRDLASVRRQWNSLWRSKMQTGNPHCPAHIKRAKAVQCKITAKAGLIAGNDMSDGSGLLTDEDGDDGSDGININVGDDVNAKQLALLTQEAKGADTATLTAEDKAALAKAKKEAKLDQKLRMAGHSRSDTSNILDAVIAIDERQAKREWRRVRKQDKRDKRNMKMFVGLVVAVNGNNNSNKNSTRNNNLLRSALDDSDSDSESSECSSTKEADSPPTKRQKRAKTSKKK